MVTQDVFPNFWKLILTKAIDYNNAAEKAENFQKKVFEIGIGLTLDDIPAYNEFEGIRKVIELDNSFDLIYNEFYDEYKDGVEISYSYMEVNSIEALKKLGKGEMVEVNYIDMDR